MKDEKKKPTTNAGASDNQFIGYFKHDQCSFCSPCSLFLTIRGDNYVNRSKVPILGR